MTTSKILKYLSENNCQGESFCGRKYKDYEDMFPQAEEASQGQ